MVREVGEKLTDAGVFATMVARASALSRGQSLRVRGLAGSLLSFVVASLRRGHAGQVLLVTAESERAEKLYDDCAMLTDGVRYCAGRPALHAAAQDGMDMSAPVGLIETLKSLSEGGPLVVVAPLDAVALPVPPVQQFRSSMIVLQVRTEHGFTQLIERLAALGFEKKEFVEGYGDFSVRGGIIDVFPYVGDNPLRLEFWGDTIESIREFDVLSQRSIRELQSALVVPAVAHVLEGSHGASLFDYLNPDALVILDEPELMQMEKDQIPSGGAARSILQSAAEFACLVHTAFRKGEDQEIVDIGSLPQPAFHGSVKTLLKELDGLSRRGIRTYIGCDTKEEALRLRELLDEERHEASGYGLRILEETVHSGFVLPSAGIALFTEHEIFGRLKRRGATKRRRLRGFTHKELQQLKRGDYVVHADYGVGQFGGLQKISLRGAEQEVMKILYLENDVLYVNLNSIGRVEKYSSREGHTPAISKLGGADWERLKQRAKGRVKDIARDLIRLYARRKQEQGFAFSPDTHWQKEMEASFVYEDTADQARASLEVKQDMEAAAPMDRLICGDVGFGKTEIAVRATFKAVQDGKQAAVLVPTTILAQQHYNTFKDRLERYPVKIEFVSRFKTRKELKPLLEGLRQGTIDVIIGTHRLLSGDVVFKDLGLLVVDEEQRFGVAAKEKLRRLKAAVDTLTLTATPIPRTLYFSLMGARDISLINTPPRNRLPIITEIVQFDWTIIREAILKEIHRGGQVYFVHDRIQRIEEMKTLLEEHAPGARYAVAHGQMPARVGSDGRGHQLERIMVDFLEKRYDVLVCTKIIESGIDIPNVNTLIINRADRFGLAELYQLRGRVGRSNVQAYSYLLTPPVSALPRAAIRRLQALEEFTELGSGFNLAMRDLEIRGAGNLLGAEQSGFMLEMGYEMYERIVREAVEELKREEFTSMPAQQFPEDGRQTAVEAGVDAFIPGAYVESDAERLEIYRRLARTQSIQQVEEILVELQDRFGECPSEAVNLLRVVRLRVLGSLIGLKKLSLDEEGISMTLPDPEADWFYSVDGDGGTSRFQRLLEVLGERAGGAFRLKQEGRSATVVIGNDVFHDGSNRLTSAEQFLIRLSA